MVVCIDSTLFSCFVREQVLDKNQYMSLMPKNNSCAPKRWRGKPLQWTGQPEREPSTQVVGCIRREIYRIVPETCGLCQAPGASILGSTSNSQRCKPDVAMCRLNSPMRAPEMSQDCFACLPRSVPALHLVRNCKTGTTPSGKSQCSGKKLYWGRKLGPWNVFRRSVQDARAFVNIDH